MVVFHVSTFILQLQQKVFCRVYFAPKTGRKIYIL